MRSIVVTLALLTAAWPSAAQDTAAVPGARATAQQGGGPATPPANNAAANQPVASGAAAESSESAYWVAFAVVTLFLVIFAVAMAVSLKKDPNWSFARTVSEESDPIAPLPPVAGGGGGAPPGAPAPAAGGGGGAPAPAADGGGGGALVPQLVGSTSRMIAAFGLMVLAVMILGIGYGIMWSLFTQDKTPDLSGIGPYLLGGSALFAPYAFNQLKEIFK